VSASRDWKEVLPKYQSNAATRHTLLNKYPEEEKVLFCLPVLR